MKFLLDTNFLMIPGKFTVDIFFELTRFGSPEFYTLDTVIAELKKIAASRGKNSRYARLALLLLKEKGVIILRAREKKADDEMVRKAREFAVCTVDRGIIIALRRKGAKIFTLKAKKFVDEV